jgi:ankyrin repeat protein
MVEECIQRKILTDREKYIALLIATRDNNETLVRKFLQANAEVNEDTLQIAVVNEHIAILKSLLPKSNCSRSHIQKGNSPLITATKRGLFKIVRCLLQNGVDINHRNVQGQSALDKAIVCNEFNICAALIQKGCQLDVKAGKFDRTPLHAAVDMGNIEIVELLLNNEASLYITDHRGDSTIHTAAVRGHMEIFRLLLNRDKSVAMNSFKYGRQITTLYHYAVIKENKELLQILIENDIDPNMQDQFGRTPLYFAVYHNKPEFVDLLIEKADVTLAENGYTPLHAAVFKLNTDLVEKLCKYYTYIRMVDRKGNSLLHVLKNVRKKRNDNDTCVRVSECIKILLKKTKISKQCKIKKEK